MENTTIANKKNNRNPQGTEVRYGPDNPHPLSQMKTELVWEGKYDEHGNRPPEKVAGCDCRHQ